MDQKKQIRDLLLTKRKTLIIDEIYNKSKIIQDALEQHPLFKSSQTILFYVSYGNEVFTHDLIKKYLKSNKTILVPYSHPETCTIEPRIITDWTDLIKGSYGILEPHTYKTQNESSIDLILLPGVGFDRKGNRLGHGKGYYDRLIHQTPNATLIGLAFDFQIVPFIPIQIHDRPVDIIISEKEIITCH